MIEVPDPKKYKLYPHQVDFMLRIMDQMDEDPEIFYIKFSFISYELTIRNIRWSGMTEQMKRHLVTEGNMYDSYDAAIEGLNRLTNKD
jgi:hypothetical protein